MASSTVEDYLKRLYLEQQRVPDHLVPMGHLAGAMDVAAGTATAMVKALAEGGLVEYEPYVGVRLSRNGQKLALSILRRHRIIELFLVQVLEMDWAEVHAEAERLEHAVSDALLERIDKYLGRPQTDPHGDPIPTAAGRVDRRPHQRLDRVARGRRCKVARVLDQSPAFLRSMARHGLHPGAPVTVGARDEGAETVDVRLRGRRRVTLADAAAAKILVDPI